MATSGEPLCGICQFRHIQKLPEEWCQECDEALCLECVEHHSASKATRGHNTVNIDEYKKLPHFILEISQNCGNHDEKFHSYCPIHEEPCCTRCLVENHSDCKDLKVLADIVVNSRSSTSISNAEQNLKDLRNSIIKALQDRRDSFGNLKIETDSVIKNIKKFRKEINEQLDDLEEQILKELELIFKKKATKFQNYIFDLEKKEGRVKQLEDHMRSIKHHASDLQVFLGTKYLENEIDEEIKNLEEDMTKGKLDNVKLVLAFDEKIQNFRKEIISFGTVSVVKFPPAISLDYQMNRQAQIIGSAVPSIGKITATKLPEILPKQVKGSSLKSCLALQDGNYVFTDYKNNRLIILNPDGSFVYDISLYPYSAYDVTEIGKSLLAVTSGSKGIISIVNMKSQIIEKKIQTTGGGCYGITYFDSALVVAVWRKGLQNLNLQNHVVKDFYKDRELTSDIYLTSSSTNVLLVKRDTSEIVCFDMSGVPIWQNQYQEMNDPRGITIDGDGFIYVGCLFSYNILVISSDGKHIKELVHQEDKKMPFLGLLYDKTRNQLIATSMGSPHPYIQPFKINR